MCDYSLEMIASRPAKVGDQLIVTRFATTPTLGFTAVGRPSVAVCLCPGTELSFNREIQRRHRLAHLVPRFGFGKLGTRVARFCEINQDKPNMHHDALALPNGRIVLLTELCVGQRATVLQLPAISIEQRELESRSARHQRIDAATR
jgi:hypothetical protein